MRIRKKSDLSNYWINRAESLHRAAVILYEHGPLSLDEPVYLMAGLSIEVLTKAILVKQQQKFANDKYSHHRISGLFSAAGINVTANQAAMVGVLEECVFWLGKYPDPSPKDIGKSDIKLKKLRKPVQTLGGFSVTTGDETKWPSCENYMDLWSELMGTYIDTHTDNSNEFGYKQKGHK
jgi:hypothetical protein